MITLTAIHTGAEWLRLSGDFPFYDDGIEKIYVVVQSLRTGYVCAMLRESFL